MGCEDNRVLVELLHEAARLEHCLLDSYLHAACSLKTLPAEFATLSDGRENRRRAIQYERVRAWKQAILAVAHEEMLHLHYVQCLIRALGSAPYLGLPERDAETGNWRFGNWTERIGEGGTGAGGTEMPVESLSQAAVRRFVMYEATDALQDEDPFGPAAMDLFSRLHDLELDYLLESTLLDVSDDSERESLKAKLAELYTSLPPMESVAAEAEPVVAAREVRSTDVQFQSIADLYNRAILPLYHEAFHYTRVPRTDLGLEGELQDPNYAAEGFLPILPVNRDKNYDQAAAARVKTPIRYYRQVDQVIAEIVEEGEGQHAFVEGAEALLQKVSELGGTRAYDCFRTAARADSTSTSATSRPGPSTCSVPRSAPNSPTPTSRSPTSLSVPKSSRRLSSAPWLPPTWSRDTVDAGISLGERLRLVAVPLGTTVVPLAVTAAVERTGFTRTWTFPPGMLDTVAGFATRSGAPFWAQFHIDGNVRTVTLADGTVLTEHLVQSTDTSYAYTATGVPGVSDYQGSFTATDDASRTPGRQPSAAPTLPPRSGCSQSTPAPLRP